MFAWINLDSPDELIQHTPWLQTSMTTSSISTIKSILRATCPGVITKGQSKFQDPQETCKDWINQTWCALSSHLHWHAWEGSGNAIQWFPSSAHPFLYQIGRWYHSNGRKWKSESVVAQSCPILCNPMDCGPPASSVQGILLARILGRKWRETKETLDERERWEWKSWLETQD